MKYVLKVAMKSGCVVTSNEMEESDFEGYVEALNDLRNVSRFSVEVQKDIVFLNPVEIEYIRIVKVGEESK